MKRVMPFILLLGLTMTLASFDTPIKKQRVGKWEKLGEKVVNMKGDFDTMPVTIFEGAFTAVKFKVIKAPIHIHSIKIHFRNGETQDFRVGRRFAAGSESRVLDLPGNKRIIKKITFKYKSIPGNGKGRAVMLAFGRH